MKSLRLFGLSFALLLTTSLAVAQDKAGKPAKAEPAAKAPSSAPPAGAAPAIMPMGPPKPTPELDAAYKMLDGSWKCDTTFAANSMSPGSPEIKVKTTMKFKRDLDGFWYRGDFEIKKTKDFSGLKGTLYLGHDGKQLLLSSVDSMGGASFGTGTAEGETLTFLTDARMMGMKMRTRETIQKNGGNEIVHRFDLDSGKGFQPMGEDVCKR